MDSVLISKDWDYEFSLGNLKKIPIYTLDHSPLVYGSDLETTTLEPLYFENTWRKHPDFIPRLVRFGEKILKLKMVWINGALRLTESRHFLTSLFFKN